MELQRRYTRRRISPDHNKMANQTQQNHKLKPQKMSILQKGRKQMEPLHNMRTPTNRHQRQKNKTHTIHAKTQHPIRHKQNMDRHKPTIPIEQPQINGPINNNHTKKIEKLKTNQS